jgi:cysteine desulfurase
VTEHKAVLDPCRRLEKEGFRVSYLPVGRDGLLDVQRLAEAITAKTILISVMYANNETGVIQPIAEIGRVARERGVAHHVDAAQAVGKIPVDVERDAIDLLSLTAHKLYGPKGIGALYVRRRAPRVEIEAQMDGGGHERGMRSGTLNVPAIVGFGRACEICRDEMAVESARLASLRDRLKDGLFAGIGQIAVNGSLEHRLPHNLSVSFAGVDGESLLLGLGADVAVSSGSACTSASPEPSHVLRAMGVPERLAHSSIRFGLGRFNTEAEVDHVIGKVEQAVGRLRELSPRHAAARK